jgi:hypothetical protein
LISITFANFRPDQMAVFDYSEELAWLVRKAGFGLVAVEGHALKKTIAVGRKSDLVGNRGEITPATHSD